MILGLLVLVVIAGIIYYSTHKIPPEPIFRAEVYVEEQEFWDDMREDDFKEEPLSEVIPEKKTVALLAQAKKKPNLEKHRQQEKSVGKRRKRRKLAKRSRQQNRR